METEDKASAKPTQRLTREQAAQIRAARLAAAVRKVKEGKALTLGEQTLIDSMTEPDRADRATWPKWCSSQAQAAAVTGIPLAAVRAAKRQGCPAFDHSRVNPRAMVEWMEARANAPAPQAQGQPLTGAQPVKRTLAQEIEDLNAMLAQVDALARDAMARGDVSTASALADQSKGWWERRKAAQVELRRQGRTEDDVLAKQDAVRIIRALAIQACHGIQRIAREAAGRLVGVVEPAEVMRILVEELTADAFLRPFEEASKLDAGHGIPAWVAEEMRAASWGLVE